MAFNWNAAQLPLARNPTVVPVDFSPINEGLDALAKSRKEAQDLAIRQDAGARLASGDLSGAQNALYKAGQIDQGFQVQQFGQKQKESAEAEQKRIVSRAGFLAQTALAEKDPNRQRAIAGRILQLDPKLSSHIGEAGVDINDPVALSKYVYDEALSFGGPKSPEEITASRLANEKDQAQIGLYTAQTDLARRKEDQTKVMEVNGRLVRVAPDGSATEIYSGGPDSTKAPQGYRYSPDGSSLVPIPGGPGDKLTDGESKDALFAERALRANKNIEAIIPIDPSGKLKGYDPTGIKQQWWPDDSRFNSAEWKSLDQAKREFIAGVLRKDTGAAITASEFSDYDRIFFPQPGDSPQALLQKKASRENAALGLRGASGRAFNRMFPDYDKATPNSGTASDNDPMGIR